MATEHISTTVVASIDQANRTTLRAPGVALAGDVMAFCGNRHVSAYRRITVYVGGAFCSSRIYRREDAADLGRPGGWCGGGGSVLRRGERDYGHAPTEDLMVVYDYDIEGVDPTHHRLMPVAQHFQDQYSQSFIRTISTKADLHSQGTWTLEGPESDIRVGRFSTFELGEDSEVDLSDDVTVIPSK